MNELKIHYPFKPFNITQHWGNNNPMYRQHGWDFDLHNGVDANIGYIENYPVYCPVEGFKVHLVRYMPQGGGNEIWLMSKKPLKIFDKTCYVYLVFCHAEKILVKEGDELEVGDLMMIADNTGFSTGLHTHIGMYRIEYDGTNIKYIDHNHANGSFSPELFFTGKYAVDVCSPLTLWKSVLRYAKYKIFGL